MTEHDMLLMVQKQKDNIIAEREALRAQRDALVEERDAFKKGYSELNELFIKHRIAAGHQEFELRQALRNIESIAVKEYGAQHITRNAFANIYSLSRTALGPEPTKEPTPEDTHAPLHTQA